MNPAWRSVSWWLGILFGAIALVVIFEAVDLSLRGKLFPLGDDITFIPGHGPTSTFGQERRSNPFVADARYA